MSVVSYEIGISCSHGLGLLLFFFFSAQPKLLITKTLRFTFMMNKHLKSSETKYIAPQVHVLHLQITQNILGDSSSVMLPEVEDGGNAI